MNKKISWLKWEDPFFPKQEPFSAEDNEIQSQKDSFFEKDKDEEPDRHMRVILGPYGTIPINENAITSKLYKMWVGHCNFDITKNIMETIEKVEGVEILRVWTRYRFWVGFGNLFDDNKVQQDIEDSIIKKNKNINGKSNALNALVKVLRKKYKSWVVFSNENGELKTIGSDNIEQIKVDEGMNILACSWDE
jgi:hypothetical protein